MEKRVLVPITCIHHGTASFNVALHKLGVAIKDGVDHVLEGASGVTFAVMSRQWVKVVVVW